MARVSELIIYPIKALCGVKVSQLILEENGIKYDRTWAMICSRGQYINGKSASRVHSINLLQFTPTSTVVLGVKGEDPVTFDLDEEEQLKRAQRWLSAKMEKPLILRKGGPFADDPRFEGPTIVSLATLQVVQGWFGLPTTDEVVGRFRPNVIVDEVPAFWEDQLCSAIADRGITMKVDRRLTAVELVGVHPVHRCVVPTRSPSNGTIDPPGIHIPGFIKKFMEQREQSFASWSPQSVLTSGPLESKSYYLCSASIVATPGDLQVGDQLRIAEEQDLKQLRATSRSLSKQYITDLMQRAYAIRAISKTQLKVASILIAILPLELSSFLLLKPLPNCVRKPTVLELLIGLFKILFLVFLFIITIIYCFFI